MSTVSGWLMVIVAGVLLAFVIDLLVTSLDDGKNND